MLTNRQATNKHRNRHYLLLSRLKLYMQMKQYGLVHLQNATMKIISRLQDITKNDQRVRSLFHAWHVIGSIPKLYTSGIAICVDDKF